MTFPLGFVTLSLGRVTLSLELVTYRPSGGKHAVPRAVSNKSARRSDEAAGKSDGSEHGSDAAAPPPSSRAYSLPG